MLVVLRDGRKLIGVLRSYDQFGEAGPRKSPYSILVLHHLDVPAFLSLSVFASQQTYLINCGLLVWTANLVLEDTVERIHHASSYGDIPRGVFLIRGENVVLLGEIVSLSTTPVPPSYPSQF